MAKTTRSPVRSFTRIAPYYDQLMSTVPYTFWVNYVEKLVARFGAQAERVLDLATGTGSVGLIFAQKGYQVTGVDASQPMLAEAAHKAEELGLPLKLIQQDLTRLSLNATFDLAVCLYDSLNYILSPEGIAGCFAGVKACLQPEGLFIFDLNTEYALKAELFTQDNLRTSEPFKYRWTSHYDSQERLSTITMEFWTPKGEEFVEVHRQRAYSPEQIDDLLQQAAFTPLACYDAFSFSPHQPESGRIYFVAHS